MGPPVLIEFVVSRSAQTKDRSRYYVVKIDGAEAARLRPDESIVLAAPEGQHVLSVSFDQSALREVTVVLQQGEDYEFVITSGDLTQLGSSWIEISES